MVASGLDRLLREGPSIAGLDAGARVALVAHAASVDAGARPAPHALAAETELRLVRILAPEHGLWGHEQDMESVGSAVDPWSGLPVVSLYGDSSDSLRPRPEHLDGLDAVIVDLQDVGSRYYTYVYTLSFVMEAARDAGLPVVVLDRPNPIDGVGIEGPLLEPPLASFVGRYPIPVRHGMTIGELGRLFRDRFGIGGDLRVVEMTGWRRPMRFDGTGLPWVPPSPNMPSLATAVVYPGGCLIEGTNLSEGRGTTTPFELVGAPWIDAPDLVRRLDRLDLPDVRFRPASFRPMFQKHAGEGCRGVQVIPVGPAFRAFETYVGLLLAAREQAPDRFAWRREVYEFERDRPAIDLLLGRAALRSMIEAGTSLERIAATWAEDERTFREERAPSLIYDAAAPKK